MNAIFFIGILSLIEPGNNDTLFIDNRLAKVMAPIWPFRFLRKTQPWQATARSASAGRRFCEDPAGLRKANGIVTFYQDLSKTLLSKNPIISNIQGSLRYSPYRIIVSRHTMRLRIQENATSSRSHYFL